MTDDPLHILAEAREAARRCAYAEALEKYLWFHQHALEHSSSLTGVRLSYAISEWVELANAYPPAMEALESIQNTNLRFLKEGSCERRQFHDFASINRYLGRFDLTTSLFAELAEHQPEFARACFRSALPALIRTRAFALARRFVSSPKEQLDSYLSEFATVLNKRERTADDDVLMGVFATQLRQLLTIFEELGENEEAHVLQGKGIEALTDPLDQEEVRRQLLWR
jgi:hypothetical protein